MTWNDDEQVVGQLREWLAETRDEALADAPDELPAVHDPVGLYEIADELTALRHDAKLQTKSVRKLQERNEQVLDGIEKLTDRLADSGPDVSIETARPLVEALIDMDEALRRGQAVMESSRRRLIEQSSSGLRQMQATLDGMFGQLPWWRQWLCRAWHRTVKEVCFPREMEEHQRILASLAEGYELILRRLDKSLASVGIAPIECVGGPADPNRMNVVEAVEDPYLPPGQVTEEVRRGYTWRGKVFRFAEVKATRA